jgi:D-alanine transaminase
MEEIVFLNNQFIPKDKASISINDRGFHFADGVYEVIKYYKSKPFRFNEHVKRLKRSLREIRIVDAEISNLENVCSGLIDMNQLNDCYAGIYIQVTRGSHPRNHSFPENIKPTVCIDSFRLSTRKEQLIDGIKVITRPDIRWLRCDIKSVSLLANVLMMQEAVESGAGECLLVRNGVITEGTRSNALGVKDEKIFTHPDSVYVLPGITKGAVKDICSENNIEFIEKSFTEDEVASLDELMVAGTGNEIMPVIQVNDVMIGDGCPGPVTRAIQKFFFGMTYESLANDTWWSW